MIAAPTLDEVLQYVELYARFRLPMFPCWPPALTPEGLLVGDCACPRTHPNRVQGRCESSGKHPMTSNGYKDATPDVAQLRGLFRRSPVPNLAIATGLAQIVGLDEDPRNGGDDALAALIADVGQQLPETWTAQTSEGGRHHYLAYPPGVEVELLRFVRVLVPGVDVKALGYLMAPPSLHPKGVRYTWLIGSSPTDLEPVLGRRPAVCPPWLWARLVQPGSSSEHPPSGAVADSLLGVLFAARGWVRDQRDPTKWGVRCPWEPEHTAGNAPTGTVLFGPREPGGRGLFDCKHGHCAGRDTDAVLATFSEQEGDAARQLLAARGFGTPRAHARRRRAETSEPPPSTFIPVEQLLTEPDVPVRWLVDGLLPAAGLSLLVAKPKVGKSTLARSLAAAVAAGQAILGRATARGGVLYVALEDHRDDVKAHMKLLKPPAAAPLYLHIGAPPSTDPVSWLRGATTAHAPVLVVIDSLGRFLRVADFNDYAQVTRATGPIIALAREGGVHILCVHHAGKAADRLAIDTTLGSTALTAFVDTILVERRYADGTRTLESIQRVGRDLPETVVALDPATGTVGAAGDLEAYRVRQLVTEIVAAVASAARTEEQLRNLLDRDRRLVGKALRQAVADGLVVRSGAGKRGDPYHYALPPAPEPGERPRSEKTESAGDPSERERPGCKPPGDSPGESEKSSLTPIGKPEARKRESGGGETPDLGVAVALAVFPGATVVGCPSCGGTTWRPNLAGDGEYCVDCGAVSPVTRSPRDPGEEG